jgi:hypothetical protein
MNPSRKLKSQLFFLLVDTPEANPFARSMFRLRIGYGRKVYFLEPHCRWPDILCRWWDIGPQRAARLQVTRVAGQVNS